MISVNDTFPLWTSLAVPIHCVYGPLPHSECVLQEMRAGSLSLNRKVSLSISETANDCTEAGSLVSSPYTNPMNFSTWGKMIHQFVNGSLFCTPLVDLCKYPGVPFECSLVDWRTVLLLFTYRNKSRKPWARESRVLPPISVLYLRSGRRESCLPVHVAVQWVGGQSAGSLVKAYHWGWQTAVFLFLLASTSTTPHISSKQFWLSSYTSRVLEWFPPVPHGTSNFRRGGNIWKPNQEPQSSAYCAMKSSQWAPQATQSAES